MSYKLFRIKDKMRKAATELIAQAASTMQSEAIKNLGGNVSADAVSVSIADGGMTAKVETNIPDASYIEYGTEAHHPHHPPTKPKPFFNRAYEAARQQLIKQLK